jgi:DNA repair ATPase RecN
MDPFTSEDCYRRRENDIKKIEEHTHGIISLEKRMNALENMTSELQKMNVSLQLMVQKMDAHQEELNEQGERINALEQVPKMRWNAVIQAIISVVIGSVLTLGIQNILVK